MARSVCSVLGLLCGLLGLSFNVISIATPHWLKSRGPSNVDVGIFRHCDIDEGYCGDMESLGLGRFINARDIVWFRVIQATFIIAIAGSLLGSVISFLSHIKFFESSGTYKTLTIINAVTSKNYCLMISPLKWSVIGLILLSGPICSLVCFPFQPVLHNWFIKGHVCIEMISLILFGLDYYDMFGLDGHVVSLSWSYYIAIVATCFTFFAVIFHAMGASRTTDILMNMQKRLTVWSTPYTLFVDQDP